MGCKLNKRNWEQETLLHLAAELKLVDVVVLLLFSGVDPNILSGDRKGVPAPYQFPSNLGGTGGRPSRPQTAMGFRTYDGGKSGVINPFYVKQERKAAIHLAAERENGITTLKTLIKHQADVNIRTSNNRTALQLALEAGKLTNQNLSILLKAGADPNAILESHQTILRLVAPRGLEETINILLAAGASTLVQDVFRQTPGELAARYGHKSIAGRLGYPTREPKRDDLQYVIPGSFPIDSMSKSVELTPIPVLILVDDFDSGETSTEKKEMKENAGFLGLVKSEWSKLRGPPP